MQMYVKRKQSNQLWLTHILSDVVLLKSGFAFVLEFLATIKDV